MLRLSNRNVSSLASEMSQYISSIWTKTHINPVWSKAIRGCENIYWKGHNTMHTRNTVTETTDHFATLMVLKPTNIHLDLKSHIHTLPEEFLWKACILILKTIETSEMWQWEIAPEGEDGPSTPGAAALSSHCSSSPRVPAARPALPHSAEQSQQTLFYELIWNISENNSMKGKIKCCYRSKVNRFFKNVS